MIPHSAEQLNWNAPQCSSGENLTLDTLFGGRLSAHPAICLADGQKDSSIQAPVIKGEPKSILFRVSERPIREDFGLPVQDVMSPYPGAEISEFLSGNDA